MYINQQDAQNSCDQTLFFNIRSICFGLYQSIFRSNFISCMSYLAYADTSGCCVSHTTARRMVPAYTGIYQIRHTAYKKTAPENGLIQSETCRASNAKIKFNHRKFCILLVYIYMKLNPGFPCHKQYSTKRLFSQTKWTWSNGRVILHLRHSFEWC